MSKLAGKMNALAVTLADVIQTAVDEALAGSNGGKTTKAKTDKKPAGDKKQLEADKKEAKQVAGKVLKELGKEILAGLLKDAGAETFPDLKTSEAVAGFMEAAQEKLDSKTPNEDEDDDLLGGGPEDKAEVERTFDDVKNKLLEINNHKKLGKDTTKEVLAGLGIQRLPQLKKENYNEAYDAANKALESA